MALDVAYQNFPGRKCSSVCCEGSLWQMLCFTKKPGRMPGVRISFALLEFTELEKAEDGLLLHWQNSNAACSIWSLSRICSEEKQERGCKAVQEYSQPRRNILWFKSSLLHKAGDGWLLQFLPMGHPFPYAGENRYIGEHFCSCRLQQIIMAVSDMLPCTVYTGFSPSSCRYLGINLVSVTDFSLSSSRNQIPLENIFGTAFISYVIDSAVALDNIQE